MNSTTLVTLVALVLGLLLASGGSVLLAHARVADRHVRPWHATITQYPAALSALLGFLLSSVAGAVLCWRQAPFRGPSGVLVAIATGVVLFAVVGAGFARVADQVEARRLRRVPDEVHRPISPAPHPRPALPSAPPATARAALATSSATPSAPAPPPQVPPPQVPPPQVPPPQVPPPQVPSSAPAKADALPRNDPLSTRLVEVRRPAPTQRPSNAPAAAEPAEAPAPILDSPPAAGDAEPGPTLEAGWMYQDEAGRWFLAVGPVGPVSTVGPVGPVSTIGPVGPVSTVSPAGPVSTVDTVGGAPLLLGLPAFALVDPGGPDAPAGALRLVGAAELTVQAEPPGAADSPSPAEVPAPAEIAGQRSAAESAASDVNADNSIPVQRVVEDGESVGTGQAQPPAPPENRPGFTHAHSRSAAPPTNVAPERRWAEGD